MGQNWNHTYNKALPRIIRSVESLMKEVSVGEALKCDSTNNYEICLLKFSARFHEHATSIIALGKSKDGWLIARSILEGLVILNWISEDVYKREERARKYILSALTEEYLHLRKLKDIGINLPTLNLYGRIKSDIEKNLNDLGLSSENKKAFASDKEFNSEFFISRLTGCGSIKKAFEKYLPLEKPKRPTYYYVLFYNFFSEYHHWNSRTLRANMVADRLLYIHGGDDIYGHALEAAFVSLHRILTLLNEKFNLKKSKKIYNSWKSYEKWRLTIMIPY